MPRPSSLLALTILLPALAVLPACRHAEVKPVEEPLRARDLYPLAIGNQWTYEIHAAGQSVLRTIEIVSQQDGFFLDSKNGRLTQDKKGLRDGDRYLIENPVEKGRSWFSVMSVESSEEFEIVDAGHPCTVQAGTFGRCVVVRATTKLDPSRSIAIESTYAEGVGLVMLHSEQSDKGQAMPVLDMELVAYKLTP
jgi:hypothetical protein